MNVRSFSFLVFIFLSFCTNHASLEIVAGYHHNCVYEPGQTGMMCWGYNAFGQLGYEDTNNRGDDAGEMSANLPIVDLGPDFSVNTTSLGWGHSCAASQEHAVKCWGDGREFQTGHATTNNLGDDAGEMGANLAFVEFRADFVPLKVAVGHQHSCVLSIDSLVVCFGDNGYGQCGVGTNDNNIIGPPSNIAVVDLGSNFTPIDIAAFYEHVCAISQQQTIKCFGYNYYGQLGYGDTTDRGETRQSMGDGLLVLSLGSNFIPKAVATGLHHTCALSTLKTVKCFGLNSQGQCGQVTPRGGNDRIGDGKNEMDDNLPVIVFPDGFVPVQMALGSYHTCILSESAQVVCFGRNNYGQLGLGHTSSPTSPTLVDLGTGFTPRKLTAGNDHTCAVSTTDTVKCWGRNEYGQLGLGHTNIMGDQANEMGDDLPIVDLQYTAATAPTTAAPTTDEPTTTEAPTSAAPTTAAPTTASPTTAASTTATPTTPAPTIASPTTAAPTTAEATGAPTAAPTTAATENPTTSTPTARPTAARPTTTAPTTTAPTTDEPTAASSASPTTAAPTTATPTTLPTEVTTLTTAESETTHAANNHTVAVTIRTDSLSSTQVLIAIANAHNLSSTLLTITTLSSSEDEGDDGFTTVELLVAVPSNVELDYDVIKATLREAMVDEYGEDAHVDIDVHGDDDDDEDDAQSPETSTLSWEMWVIAIVGSIVVCACCVAAVGLVYVRRQRNKNAVNVPPPQPAAAAVPPPPQQAAVPPRAPPPPPPRVVPAPAAALVMASVLSHSLPRVVFPGAVDHNERKQGEEDVELEMAPIKKQAAAFVYDPNRNYKPEGERVSLVTPGVNRNVIAVEEEKSDSEELYAGNSDDSEDMYDVKETRIANSPKTITTKKTNDNDEK